MDSRVAQSLFLMIPLGRPSGAAGRGSDDVLMARADISGTSKIRVLGTGGSENCLRVACSDSPHRE